MFPLSYHPPGELFAFHTSPPEVALQTYIKLATLSWFPSTFPYRFLSNGKAWYFWVIHREARLSFDISFPFAHQTSVDYGRLLWRHQIPFLLLRWKLYSLIYDLKILTAGHFIWGKCNDRRTWFKPPKPKIAPSVLEELEYILLVRALRPWNQAPWSW